MPLTEEQEKELEPIVSGITGALRELNARIGKGAAEIKSLTAAISPQAAEQALQAASDETNRYIEFRRQLSQNLVSVHERWQGLVKTRHPEIAAALDGGTELLGRAGELLDNLEQGVADASDYLEEIGEAREALRETIRSSVEDAFDSAGAAAEALGEGLRERLDTLTEHVEELEEKISAALEEAAEEVGEALLVPVKELSEAIKDALKDLSDFVTAKVRDAVLDSVDEAFVTPAREKIDELAGRLEAELVALGEKLVGESDKTNSKREALKMALDILKPADAAVRPALDAFKAIAGSVGVPIG